MAPAVPKSRYPMSMKAKHIGALLLGCVLSALPAYGQEFHLSGGYNGSNVREAGYERWVGRAGYQFGADLLLGGVWFVRAGAHLQVRNLNYTVAGLDPNGDPIGTDTEFRYTSRSLRVPLGLGRHLLDPAGDPPINVYVLAGPTALFNLTAELENDQLDVRTNATQWYLGFAGGVELGFLFAEAGYDLAMTDVFSGQGFRTDPRVNQVYAVAGLRFQLAH